MLTMEMERTFSCGKSIKLALLLLAFHFHRLIDLKRQGAPRSVKSTELLYGFKLFVLFIIYF